MLSLKKLRHKCVLLFLLAVFVSALPGLSACNKNPGEPVIAAENNSESAMPVPAAEDITGWSAGESKSFSGEQLFGHIDGGADIYFEYGFERLLVSRLVSGEKKVSLEIYRMSDPAAAYGIFSYNRNPSLSSASVGTEAVSHPNGLFFWQDRYYVDIRQLGPIAIPSEETLALGRAVSKKIASTAEMPAIMDSLPEESRVPRTEVFARGKLAINNQVYVSDEDFFGLQDGEAAAIARYRIGQPEFSVIVADYAGAEACRDAFVRFCGHFLGGGKCEAESFSFSPMPGKHDAIRKIGDKLIVAANADSREHALEMLEKTSESISK